MSIVLTAANKKVVTVGGVTTSQLTTFNLISFTVNVGVQIVCIFRGDDGSELIVSLDLTTGVVISNYASGKLSGAQLTGALNNTNAWRAAIEAFVAGLGVPGTAQ